MIYPWVEITSVMGAALESLDDMGNIVFTHYHLLTTTYIAKNLFYTLYMISKL